MYSADREGYISKNVKSKTSQVKKKLSDLVLKKEGGLRKTPEPKRIFAPRTMKLSPVQFT
jgi:hypothetical protein